MNSENLEVSDDENATGVEYVQLADIKIKYGPAPLATENSDDEVSNIYHSYSVSLASFVEIGEGEYLCNYEFQVSKHQKSQGEEPDIQLVNIEAQYLAVLRINDQSKGEAASLPHRLAATIVWTRFSSLLETISAQMGGAFPALPITPESVGVSEEAQATIEKTTNIL